MKSSLLPRAAAFLPLAVLLPLTLSAGPRVLPPGQLPADRRLEPLKDLNGYFPFTPVTARPEWTARAEEVRRRILVSQGLWPLPARNPLNAVIHGKIDEGGYTIEKVCFESFPGLYVTGSLYRPKGKSGPFPGVASPHGHWANGRFYDQQASVRSQIVIGAERFEEGGRNPLQARSVQLARMGCVVFLYDMLGYADSQQLSFQLVHRFAQQRPEMNTPANWGFYSPQAEAHLQSVMGLQSWNSIRVLDFLESLPDVDRKRLAVTGASGGGTQTMLLAAVDERVALSMPMVMVSTSMQGGCTCENSSLLRIDTGNVEFAALFAPKPQIMNCADDWTREMATKGFPELVKQYEALGGKGLVSLIRGEHFKHNYNYVSRAAMYSWINRHFKLRHKEPVVEEDFKYRGKDDLTVWDARHPQPPGGDDFERQLTAALARDSAKQLEPAAKSAAEFRAVHGGAWETLIGRTYARAGEIEWDLKAKQDRGGHLEMAGLLRNTTHGEELPVLWLYPKNWQGRTAIWLNESGKAALLDDAGAPTAEVRRLLDAGVTVLGADLIHQGEFLKPGEKFTQTGRVKNTREFAGYTFGYNHTVFARRVHDVLSLVKFINTYPKHQNRELDLIALDRTSAIAAAARALCREQVNRAALNTAGFRFAGLTDLHDPYFIPGAVKYGDVDALVALNAPAVTWLADTKAQPLAQSIYRHSGKPAALTASKSGKAADAVTYLLK